MAVPFKDRYDAGRQLAQLLTAFANRSDTIVLGLARGGVPVAYEVASTLDAPLDVFVVRKLGVPGHEELAMGAIASGGEIVLNKEVIQDRHISDEQIEHVVVHERVELSRRERRYRNGNPAPSIKDRTALLIDDGLATGSTMRAAAIAIRMQEPKQIVVAVPISDPGVCENFRELVEEIICIVTPEPLYAVGIWYRDFAPTTDDEVSELLRRRQDASRTSKRRIIG